METAAQIRAVEGSEKQFELSFSSELPYPRWFGNEVLCHDTGAVDLARLNAIGVVLFNHGRDVLGGIPVGKVIRAWLDEATKRCKAIVEFDSDEQSDLIRQKVESGTLKGVSVGYKVDCWETIAAGKTSSNGRFQGPAEVATKWFAYEISIVSVPADETVGVGRSFEEPQPAASREDSETQTNKEEKERMNEDEKKLKAEEAQRALEVEAQRQEAVKMERQRVTDVSVLCREFGVEPQDHIAQGRSLDEVRAMVLEEMKKRNAPSAGGTVEVLKDEGDKFRTAASDAILLRSGIRIDKPADGSHELRGLSLRDLAIESLRMVGVEGAARFDNDRLFRDALTAGGAFGSIMDNTVNKSMKTAYTAQGTTFDAWTSKGSNPDFKAVKKYQISEAGDLERIPENGEFKHDEMKDEGVSTALLTFGKQFSISRQALINDDISVLTKLPAAYVRAARRGINRGVYQMLGTNPSIYDGTALFHANHANLATSNAAISVAAVGAARAAMRKQKNLRGNEILNIAPKFLIVPAALETDAEKFAVSIADPSQANPNVINPFARKLTIIADAELDAHSATAWYLAADPADCDNIEVTYLNGSDMPMLESQISFDQLGMKWRIYIDYGITVLDYRGMHKNIGV